jgi:hydroxymethylpyrimidine/phosphomethylpyrimidine kinase
MDTPPSDSLPRPAILSIAGFDPTSGAGILADTAVFRALGFHPLTALTSLAAQGASHLRQIHNLPEEFLIRQLEIIAAEFHPAAVKIGMLYSPEAVQVVAAFVRAMNIPAVLDPVLRATSGGDLIKSEALPLLEGMLVPVCRLVTPNLAEAGYFLDRKITTLADAEEAAQELAWLWNTAVLLKGGHLEGDPVDILAEGGTLEKFTYPRAAAEVNLRGTGCALSSALAAGLAKGMNLSQAVAFARDFLQEAVNHHYLAATDPSTGFLDFPQRPI